MNVRTVDELERFLDKETSWRKKEILVLDKLLSNARGHEKSVLKRFWIVAYYAHWEGFVKFSSEAYLRHVSAKKIPHDQLSVNFVTVSLKSELKGFQESNKATHLNETVTKFINLRDQTTGPDFVWMGEVDTHHNLKSSVFREISTMLGIDITKYEIYFNLLSSLTENRHKIAHGKRNEIDDNMISEIQESVPMLTGWWKSEILNSVCRKTYLRHPPENDLKNDLHW